jgi:hypothetical protein
MCNVATLSQQNKWSGMVEISALMAAHSYVNKPKGLAYCAGYIVFTTRQPYGRNGYNGGGG